MSTRPPRFSSEDNGFSQTSRQHRETRLESLERASRDGPWQTSPLQGSTSPGRYLVAGSRGAGADRPEDQLVLPIMHLHAHRAIWFGRDYIGGWMAGFWVITLLAIFVLLQFVRA
jgi:hypothetical protein